MSIKLSSTKAIKNTANIVSDTTGTIADLLNIFTESASLATNYISSKNKKLKIDIENDLRDYKTISDNNQELVLLEHEIEIKDQLSELILTQVKLAEKLESNAITDIHSELSKRFTFKS